MGGRGLANNEAYKTALEMYKREHDRWVQNALYLFGFFAGIFALTADKVSTLSTALLLACIAAFAMICVALSIRASTDSWRDTLIEIEVYPTKSSPFHIFSRHQYRRSYWRDFLSLIFPVSAAEIFSVTRIYARLAILAFLIFLLQWRRETGISMDFLVNLLKKLPWIILGTWTLVCVTCAAIVYQVRETARTRSAEAMAKFGAIWDSERTRKARRRLALALGEGEKVNDIPDPAIEDVLNIFEDLGSAVRERYLSAASAYALFFDDATHWWAAAGKDYAAKCRSEDSPEDYSEFEWLVDQLNKIENKRTGRVPPMSDLEIFRFLKAESQLDQPLALKSGEV